MKQNKTNNIINNVIADKKRIFISIPLTEEIITAITKIQKKIKNSSSLEAKFVESQNLHLTLNFLGTIDNEDIADLIGLLKNVKHNAFSLTLSNLEYKHSKNKKIIWINIFSQSLIILAQKIETCLKDFKLPETRSADHRAFSGHITLARVKKILDHETLSDLIENTKIADLSLVVNQFDLMESELTSEGPIYNKIMTYELDKIINTGLTHN